MAFSEAVRQEALVRSGRRCCVCREFGGRSVEIHHIVPEADGGDDSLDNAIVLCFDCHCEAGHYNRRHPKGTKYSPEELRRHRDQLWGNSVEIGNESQGCDLSITYLSVGSSNKDAHLYYLMVALMNRSPRKQSGCTLQLFFPQVIPVEWAPDYIEDSGVQVAGQLYRRLTLQLSEAIYRDQTIQIVDQLRHPISYQMNGDIFWNYTGLTFRWTLYCGDLPVIEGQKPWDSMNQF